MTFRPNLDNSNNAPPCNASSFDESRFVKEAQHRASKQGINKCLFHIPESLHSTPMDAQSGSHLLRLLPADIITLIFDESDPSDQLALALSCKRLLNIATLIHLKYNAATAVLASPDEREKRAETIARCLFRIGGELGHPLQAWRLCAQCLRYRPTAEKYWDAKMDDKKGPRRRYRKECSEQAIVEWNRGEEWECPTCQVSKYILWGPRDLTRACLKCWWCKKWVYEESRIVINGRAHE
ncbi:hypothetical protein VTO42DRAFT_4392 [Malbranchea cinnamomea]